MIRKYDAYNEITITPNKHSPYMSVFTNKDKSRIGICLLRARKIWGQHPVFLMDSRVIPDLVEALKALQGVV